MFQEFWVYSYYFKGNLIQNNNCMDMDALAVDKQFLFHICMVQITCERSSKSLKSTIFWDIPLWSLLSVN
jgi:hypothetical protein